MGPQSKTSLQAIARRALTLVLSCSGLVWGVLFLPRCQAIDDFQEIESRLLRFETFDRIALKQTLESQASQVLSECDTHPQRALLLIEMPLAETALRSGAANEFDHHIQSLETRARRILGCTPRDSFAWLLAFDLEVLHGRLNEQSFNLLGMSYETSPNEAWISIRRIIVAMPLVVIAPELIRQKILHEFKQLIRYGFVNEAARSYSVAAQPVRSLLQTQIEQLDVSQQTSFSDALRKSRS